MQINKTIVIWKMISYTDFKKEYKVPNCSMVWEGNLGIQTHCKCVEETETNRQVQTVISLWVLLAVWFPLENCSISYVHMLHILFYDAVRSALAF